MATPPSDRATGCEGSALGPIAGLGLGGVVRPRFSAGVAGLRDGVDVRAFRGSIRVPLPAQPATAKVARDKEHDENDPDDDDDGLDTQPTYRTCKGQVVKTPEERGQLGRGSARDALTPSYPSRRWSTG
jgi:hypothetical protein